MSAILELRRRLVMARRTIGDLAAGRAHRYASAGTALPPDARTQLFVEQALSVGPRGTAPDPGDHVDAKRHNIRRAGEAIGALVIAPGEIFSFWRMVGRPSRERGFRQGRSLVGGRLMLDDGGGLCQLAGMLYLASLRGGLEVLERHAHTRDIYAESERYAPLGADAAVAYGLKDLRVRNPHPFPVAFATTVDVLDARVALIAPLPLRETTLEFVRRPGTAGMRSVDTYRTDGAGRTHVAVSTYIIADGARPTSR